MWSYCSTFNFLHVVDRTDSFQTPKRIDHIFNLSLVNLLPYF